jgi:peptidyl-prolyl cis-trans isomerase C
VDLSERVDTLLPSEYCPPPNMLFRFVRVWAVRHWQPRGWLCAAAVGMLAAAQLRVVAQRMPTPAADAAHEAAESARRAQAVASFAANRITLGDMEDVIARKLPQERKQIAAPGGRERVLSALVRYDLLAAEAVRRGYASQPAVRDAARATAIAALTTQESDAAAAAVSDADVARAATEHAAEFARPLMRRAAHIQLATREAALALSHELHGVARERFARLAVERSGDARTQRQGGELGYFDSQGRTNKGQPTGVAPPLVAATFALAHVSDVSAPVEHDGVFSLVMLTGEMPALAKPRAAIEAVLRERLVEAARNQAIEQLVSRLRAQLQPQVHAELLAAIQLDPGAASDIPQGFPAAPVDPREPPHLLEPDVY